MQDAGQGPGYEGTCCVREHTRPMIPPLQLHRTVHGELEGLFRVLDAALPWSETSPVTTGFAGTVLDATWGVGYLLASISLQHQDISRLQPRDESLGPKHGTEHWHHGSVRLGAHHGK